jgi:RHS repeat-associated protein
LTGLRLDEVFARVEPATTRSLLTDALGSTIALSDQAAVPITDYTYAPFGMATSVGGSTNTIQFTGRENDGIGLQYHRARYYDPAQQRFISEDPLGLRGGDINSYAYVGNNPTQGTDPLGLYKRDVHYDQTLAIAIQVGICVSDAEAIAHYNQLMDDDPFYSPFDFPYFTPRNLNAREAQHFPTPEALAWWRNAAMTWGGSGAVAYMGMYLHALQDSFSHQRGQNTRSGEPYGYIFGHILDSLWRDPDNPRNRPWLWREMIQTTGAELWRWHMAFPGCNTARVR